MLGFSLTSPDLVICGGGSPDIPTSSYGDSPDFLKNNKFSVEVYLENGINGSHDTISIFKNPSVKFSSFNQEFSPESSLELLPALEMENNLPQHRIPGISSNAGTGYHPVL